MDLADRQSSLVTTAIIPTPDCQAIIQWMKRDCEPACRRTTLILGNVRDTVPTFVQNGSAPPVGFVSIDVDLHSSTMQTLQLFTLPGRKLLGRTFIYFDDADQTICHRFAGELLAIDDFNIANDSIKIDQLRGFSSGRPFPEKQYLRMMYVAHDLAAISNYSSTPDRRPMMMHVLR